MKDGFSDFGFFAVMPIMFATLIVLSLAFGLRGRRTEKANPYGRQHEESMGFSSMFGYLAIIDLLLWSLDAIYRAMDIPHMFVLFGGGCVWLFASDIRSFIRALATR